MLEVIDTVKRASGVDFKVELAPPTRRPGPDRRRVGQIRALLGWQPSYDDLDLIVTHALKWERELGRDSKPPAVARAG